MTEIFDKPPAAAGMPETPGSESDAGEKAPPPGITRVPKIWRDGGGRFVKGQSGNPLGRRPKRLRAIGTWQANWDLIDEMEEVGDWEGTGEQMTYYRAFLRANKKKALTDTRLAIKLYDRVAEALAAHSAKFAGTLETAEKLLGDKRDLLAEQTINQMKRRTRRRL